MIGLKYAADPSKLYLGFPDEAAHHGNQLGDARS